MPAVGKERRAGMDANRSVRQQHGRTTGVRYLHQPDVRNPENHHALVAPGAPRNDWLMLPGILQSVCDDVPDTSTFFTAPSAANPMKRLSGDQKMPAGLTASVPGSGRASDGIERADPEP